jgi:hypothetical protein
LNPLFHFVWKNLSSWTLKLLLLLFFFLFGSTGVSTQDFILVNRCSNTWATPSTPFGSFCNTCLLLLEQSHGKINLWTHINLVIIYLFWFSYFFWIKYLGFSRNVSTFKFSNSLERKMVCFIYIFIYIYYIILHIENAL